MASVPVMIGQRLAQLAAARALPQGPRVVGSQAAGAQASGPFVGGFSTNLPPALQRPGLVGRGVAGALGAGSMAIEGGGSSQPETLMDQIMGERSGSPYGSLPPAGSFPGMTDEAGLRGQTPSPYGSLPPAGSFPGMGGVDAMRVGQAPPVDRQQLFDILSSYGAGSPLSQPSSPYGSLPSADSFQGMAPPAASGVLPLPPAREVGPAPGMNAPMTMPRPVAAPMRAASATPSVRESFMQRLLSGPDYQSNSMPVVAQPQGPMGADMRGAPMPMQANPMTAQQINWGDPENAADFFRADRALQNLPPEVLRGLLG